MSRRIILCLPVIYGVKIAEVSSHFSYLKKKKKKQNDREIVFSRVFISVYTLAGKYKT